MSGSLNGNGNFEDGKTHLAQSDEGMVASAHPLATGAGLRVLKSGGNAVDAAVAVASTLNVVEPFMSGVGGIGVSLIYWAEKDQVRALDFSGNAPKNVATALFTEKRKSLGPIAMLVPGNLAGWAEMHRCYGSKEWELLFEDAIKFAEEGFQLTKFGGGMIRSSASRLSNFPSSTILLDDSGEPLSPGETLRLPLLAKSLCMIAAEGAETFYTGELAESIVAGLSELGGIITKDDLAHYSPSWKEPISVGYRGNTIYAPPPNSTAFQILQTLKLLEQFDLSDLSFAGSDFLHIFIESIKLAVSDRIQYAGDPEISPVPISALLSEDYACSQKRRIDLRCANNSPGDRFLKHRPSGSLLPGEFDGGMTTHFAVADRQGNVVNITQTLGGAFGSSLAPKDTGIFMNNMCHWFDLEEGSPNIIGPGKKVDFCCSPTQIFKKGKFFASVGTPGSWGIMQTTPQIIVNLLDRGMDIQQAIKAPRLKSTIGRKVEAESRFPTETFNGLKALGHEITDIGSFSRSVGGAQGITQDESSRRFSGGADPRRDGYAQGI